MVKARKYVVKKKFEGMPKWDDFEIVEYELPPLYNGEVMVKTEWISIDPYMRAHNLLYETPYDQFGYQIGKIIESKHLEFPVGERIVSFIGWCDCGIIKICDDSMTKPFKLPDLKNLPISYGLGAVGMLGVTAYFGLLEICKPKPGETIVVTGAAGAVGSLAGQIGKIKGCRVIGFTGSNDKVKWLEQSIGFDKAYNYKTVDITKVLKEAAPNGLDCYFDNVGGEISSAIIKQMNEFGRVAVCGSISTYSESPLNISTATTIQLSIVLKQLKMEGFLAHRWADRSHEAFSNIIKWIESGKLKVKEHITEGFENVFHAFVEMLSGENIGKSLVRI